MSNESRIAPERIWATINGARTVFPSRARYLVGGWEEATSPYATSQRAIEYIRADTVEAILAERERSRRELTELSLTALDLAEALKMTAGALQAAAPHVVETVTFTGDWSHLGTRRVSDILDAADAALKKAEGVA